MSISSTHSGLVALVGILHSASTLALSIGFDAGAAPGSEVLLDEFALGVVIGFDTGAVPGREVPVGGVTLGVVTAFDVGAAPGSEVPVGELTLGIVVVGFCSVGRFGTLGTV